MNCLTRSLNLFLLYFYYLFLLDLLHVLSVCSPRYQNDGRQHRMQIIFCIIFFLRIHYMYFFYTCQIVYTLCSYTKLLVLCYSVVVNAQKVSRYVHLIFKDLRLTFVPISFLLYTLLLKSSSMLVY